MVLLVLCECLKGSEIYQNKIMVVLIKNTLKAKKVLGKSVQFLHISALFQIFAV